jgi:uncharacterized membrane protein
MNILLSAILIAVLDIPWLVGMMPMFQSVFSKIQGGRPMEFRLLSGLPVYIALAYILSKANSIQESFLLGAATYSVYDFTMLATFKDYPYWIAIADAMWGGILLSGAWMVLRL